ncbi:dephospho-CoA kinase [Parvularcula sp. ZS-1/3]|uniref:Dephospho-CoA kinase n=1 Tax=Parvularcula mediterranea TaxID=2732508 RepID=A0A7Y3W4H0_9PROT|nr:dephospho-CoA kinase [Parvularcula mediterranea]NNU15740.1 dephospho-CoA kinase [Parvularcula mediterranea]
MISVGLTGSIGMGKSTTAKMFAEEGAAVWDADAAVHRLYAPGGAAVAPVGEAFPSALSEEGGIDRDALSREVVGQPDRLKALEAVVHPLVAEDRQAFIEKAKASGADFVVLDIPLLVENGAPGFFDAVVVCTADEAIRRERVLARPGMTEDKLDAILARQAPEAERLRHATYTVRTDKGLDHARAEVAAIMADLREKHGLAQNPERG